MKSNINITTKEQNIEEVISEHSAGKTMYTAAMTMNVSTMETRALVHRSYDHEREHDGNTRSSCIR